MTKDTTNYDFYRSLLPEQYPTELEAWYQRKTGNELDLQNVQSFTEKIQWLKLYDNLPIKQIFADKFLVRRHVKHLIGERYLTQLYGIWERFEDIDFNTLPEKFVLKTNHGSGTNLLVKDKSKLDILSAKKFFDECLNKNYAFTNGFELQYQHIKPHIIAEEYLDIDNNTVEYTVYCFNGQPKFTQLEIDRFSDNPKRAIYDNDWKLQDFCMSYEPYQGLIRKPSYFDELLRVATTLSETFKFVRVDFYGINDKLYFGEMTFTTGSGLSKFIPAEANLHVGSMLQL